MRKRERVESLCVREKYVKEREKSKRVGNFRERDRKRGEKERGRGRELDVKKSGEDRRKER